MADLIITAASVVPGTGSTSSGIIGETLVAGDVVYRKAADARMWKAQNDGTPEEATVAGVALNGGAPGQPVTFQQGGPMNIGATTVKNTTYMLSAAVGKICPQADLLSTNRVVRVGYATGVVGEFVVDISLTGVTL